MSFEVIPASVPALRSDWKRARSAPASELPELNAVQRAEVKQFSLKEDDYRRLRVLLRRYVLERQQRQGIEFGKQIEQILAPLGGQYSLVSVSRRGTPLGWRVTVRHEERGDFEFQCRLDVVDALTNGSASLSDQAGFRDNVYAHIRGVPVLGATG